MTTFILLIIVSFLLINVILIDSYKVRQNKKRFQGRDVVGRGRVQIPKIMYKPIYDSLDDNKMFKFSSERLKL